MTDDGDLLRLYRPDGTIRLRVIAMAGTAFTGSISAAYDEDGGPITVQLGPEYPDTDIRCDATNADGQCLDHQGHLGNHQWPAETFNGAPAGHPDSHPR